MFSFAFVFVSFHVLGDVIALAPLCFEVKKGRVDDVGVVDAISGVDIVQDVSEHIGQVAFFQLSSECDRPYGHDDLNSKYYKSKTVEPSRMHLNFKNEKKSKKK